MAAFLERVANQHRGHRHQSKERQASHSAIFVERHPRSKVIPESHIVSMSCRAFIKPSRLFHDFFRSFQLLWNRHDPPKECECGALAGSGGKEIAFVPDADAVQFGSACSRGRDAFLMDVPEQPGAMFALLAVFVVVGFLFLLGLAKGRLSNRQQTVAWVAAAVLFFSLCSVLVRGNAETTAKQGSIVTPSPGSTSAVEISK